MELVERLLAKAIHCEQTGDRFGALWFLDFAVWSEDLFRQKNYVALDIIAANIPYSR